MPFIDIGADLILYSFIIVSTNIIATASIWPMMFEFLSFKFSLGYLKNFKPILVLFLPIVATSLFTQLDTILVGQLSGFKQVSFYAMALSIISIPKILVSSFGSVAMPHVAKQVNEEETEHGNDVLVSSVSNFLIFSGIVLVFTSLNANDIVLFLYGTHFKYSAGPLIILTFMFPFYVIGNIIRTQILIPQKNDKPYVISILIAALVNIVGNILLVPKYGAIGGAIAMTLTEFSIFLIEFLFVKKMIFWLMIKKIILKYAFSIIFIWAAMYEVQTFGVAHISNILVRLILNILLLLCLIILCFAKELKLLGKLIYS